MVIVFFFICFIGFSFTQHPNNVINDPEFTDSLNWNSLASSGNNISFNQPGLLVSMSNTGNNVWDTNVNQPLDFESGLYYRITLSASTTDGSSSRQIRISCNTGNPNYTTTNLGFYDFYLNGNPNIYSFCFQATDTVNLGQFAIYFGQFSSVSVHVDFVYVDELLSCDSTTSFITTSQVTTSRVVTTGRRVTTGIRSTTGISLTSGNVVSTTGQNQVATTELGDVTSVTTSNLETIGDTSSTIENSKKSNTIPIAIGVSIGVIVILGIVIAVIFVTRKKRQNKEEEKDIETLVLNARSRTSTAVYSICLESLIDHLNRSNRSRASSTSSAQSVNLRSSSMGVPITQNPEILEKFERMLTRKDALLLKGIAESTAITEADKVAKSLVIVFGENSYELINVLVEGEVREASHGTLLRSNSLASKAFSCYAKYIGQSFLFETLNELISDVCKVASSENSFEVDPNKVPSQSVDANLERLKNYCQKFLTKILTSSANTPEEFHRIFKNLSEQVSKKFPEKKYSAIGSFVFLRFFCPAIVSPQNSHIVQSAPSEPASRALKLITKVLQNVASNTEFKEEYLFPLNLFIKSQQEHLRVYFDSVCALGGSKGKDSVNQEDKLLAVSILFTHTKSILPKMKGKNQSMQCVQELESIYQEV